MGNLQLNEQENNQSEFKFDDDDSKFDESKLEDVNYLAQLYEESMNAGDHTFYSYDSDDAVDNIQQNQHNTEEIKINQNENDTDEIKTNLSFPFESLSRKNNNSIHINGLTRNEIERYLEHGGIGVSALASRPRIVKGRAMCRTGYVKRIKWNEVQFKDVISLSDVMIKTQVQSESDSDETYTVKIFLTDCETVKKANQQFQITITDSKSIQQTHCNCEDNYGDLDCHRKKCKHVASTLEGIHHPYIRNGRVSTAKSSFEKNVNIQEMHNSVFKIGNVIIPILKTPATFPGPTDAFNFENAAPIIQWLSDDNQEKSNLAAILVWMYCGNGAINSIAPKCKYANMNCNKQYMTFDVNALEWRCYGYHIE
eukprot:162806_1